MFITSKRGKMERLIYIVVISLIASLFAFGGLLIVGYFGAGEVLKGFIAGLIFSDVYKTGKKVITEIKG